MKKLHDAYFKQAKKDGYFARSAYKLEAIDNKFKLIKPGNSVLDLGSSPGSWLQYLSRKLGEKAKLAGIDINPVKPSVKKICLVLKKSIHDCTPEDFASVAQKFNVIVSDMAPKTTGIRLTDQAGSLELAEIAFEFACKMLKKGGNFTAKIFESPEVKPFSQRVAEKFAEVKIYKPPASRDESFETFVVGLGFGEKPKPKFRPSEDDQKNPRPKKKKPNNRRRR